MMKMRKRGGWMEESEPGSAEDFFTYYTMKRGKVVQMACL